MDTATLQTISPIDHSVYVERPLARASEIDSAVLRSRHAQCIWQQLDLEQRTAICRRAVDYFELHRQAIAQEISWQMGRPIADSVGEIAGVAERAHYMMDIAASALCDIEPEFKPGFKRFIHRQPLGMVFIIAPWNYPLLTPVNALIPALMAGNSVLIKPSAQTPLSGERFVAAFQEAGAPEGLLQCLHLSHEDTTRLVGSGLVDFVAFTGSIAAGRSMEHAAAGQFLKIGLELGGKDPAYVRKDANIEQTVAGLVEGAFFNAGQSCCGIERIYVEAPLYKSFVEAYVAEVKTYQLGNPLDVEVSLGPVVTAASAERLRCQVAQAEQAGAQTCIEASLFSGEALGKPYLAPQVLIDVDHQMAIMRDESFGPVVGIMPVDGDEQAVSCMNDSEFGLTASIWTRDAAIAEQLGYRLQAGTIYMNRCDYLDPALAWTGVKNTGRGVSLSVLGYEQLTQPQSFHFKL